MAKTLNKLSSALIATYDRISAPNHDKTISVNPLVAELASWYEKFRTAMDYREDEVILRSAIERILKRRLTFGGKGQTVAAPLIRELVWARYFPDSSIPESLVSKVEEIVDLYLELEMQINKKHSINKGKVNEWIVHLLSSEIEHILKHNDPKEQLAKAVDGMKNWCQQAIEYINDTLKIENEVNKRRMEMLAKLYKSEERKAA